VGANITPALRGLDDPYRINICRTERWFMLIIIGRSGWMIK